MKKIELNDIKKEAFELPEDFPYILPKDVSAFNERMYKDIIEYGLFMHKNKIYTVASGKAKPPEDGFNEDIEYKAFKTTSNFSIEIIQHMEDEKRPMRLVKITNIHRRQRIFECLSSMFSSTNKFKELVEGWGNYQFKGSHIDYEKLKSYLMDRMGDGRMITVLGWQPEGFFAFNNVAIDTQIYEYNSYGVFEYEKSAIYLPSANKIYAKNETKFINQKKVMYIDRGITFKKWCAQMNLVHREHAMLSISFIIACLFSDFIFKYHSFFPMIFLYGEASTGKSKMVEQLQSLFGIPQSPMTITGKANTDKAKIRKFAQFNNMLVFLEEFRNNVGNDTIEMLKGLWNRYGYERGNIDSDYGTDTVPISSGVILTGNDYPTDDALLTRLLIDEMMKSEFNETEKRNFGKLIDMQKEGYSNIVLEIIRHRAYFEKEYIAQYKRTKEELTTFMLGLQGVDDRMIENMSILLSVYTLMSKKIEFSYTKMEFKNYLKVVIDRQNKKRDTGGQIAKFWDIFLQLFTQDKVVEINKEFKIEGTIISFRYSRIHSSYMRKHYDIYKSIGVDKSTLRDKIKKHISFIEEVKKCRIGGTVSTAISVDLNKIDEDIRNTILSHSYQVVEMIEKQKIKATLEHLKVM